MYKCGKEEQVKHETISRKAPVMTFVLFCSFNRPVKYGSGEIARGKSFAGSRRT